MDTSCHHLKRRSMLRNSGVGMIVPNGSDSAFWITIAVE